jgi:hypothetical protein
MKQGITLKRTSVAVLRDLADARDGRPGVQRDNAVARARRRHWIHLATRHVDLTPAATEQLRLFC